MSRKVFSSPRFRPQMRQPAAWFVMLVVVAIPVLAEGPSVLHYHSSDGSQATVSGTSTMHDWSIKSTAIVGDAILDGDWQSGPTIKSITLSIASDSLKSSEGNGMDKKVYGALDQKHFPTIIYKLDTAKLESHDNTDYHFSTTGHLTVAGATHPLSLQLDVQHHPDDKITVETQTAFKMSDYGIKPPTAMAGFIKSGDAITIKATWQLSLQTN